MQGKVVIKQGLCRQVDLGLSPGTTLYWPRDIELYLSKPVVSLPVQWDNKNDFVELLESFY